MFVPTNCPTPTVSDARFTNEILQVDQAFRKQTGKEMPYLGPPGGEFSERTLKLAETLGYRSVFWSFAYRDWVPGDQKGSEYAYNRVMMECKTERCFFSTRFPKITPSRCGGS
ncbi:polysaccharide deacetylase family protein [Kyrpidia sp.]|uniref:polysaccharide deacetylase family protein n=1 Tax=Kyrpidia sp. TaxID=2073077 RepID=UPI00338E7621|nr:polysaccharide deacetylase family protein [Kyrpidia sp.]